MAASFELGCARTRYFNMLPSRLDGFGVDNFLFFSKLADMFLLTRGSNKKKRLLKPETHNGFL